MVERGYKGKKTLDMQVKYERKAKASERKKEGEERLKED